MRKNVDVKGFTFSGIDRLPLIVQYLLVFFSIFGMSFCGSIFLNYLIFNDELMGFNQVYINLIAAFIVVTPSFVRRIIKHKKEA